jgi:Transcription factor S-II (TFIIS)
MQCPKEGCNGEEAAFFQVQIRSADEPMTGFYKVGVEHGLRREESVLTETVYDLWKSVERELKPWEMELGGFGKRSGWVLVLYLIAIQRGVWKGYEDFVEFYHSLLQSLAPLTPNVDIKTLKLLQCSPIPSCQ